jgi:hypothetical protein
MSCAICGESVTVDDATTCPKCERNVCPLCWDVIDVQCDQCRDADKFWAAMPEVRR